MSTNLKKNLNKYAFPAVSLMFIIWALYLRIEKLANRTLWGDERFQWNHVEGPFQPFWKRLTYGDMTCFPGEYLLTFPFVRLFGSDKWGINIPHILMTVLGFYVLYIICERYYKTFLGYTVAFAIVCFNAHLIFHSFEFRPYAVLPTLALISFYFSDILFNEYRSLSFLKKFGIGLFFCATIWFHAFGVLLVVCPLFYFFLINRKDPEIYKRKGVVQFAVTVGAIAFPVWLWYATGNPLGKKISIRLADGMNVLGELPDPMENFLGFFNRVFLYNLIGFKRLNFLIGGLALLIFVPMKEKMRKWGFFLVMIVLPIEATFVAALHNNYWFASRQYTHLAPLLAFFLGWLWDSSLLYYRSWYNERFELSWSAKFGLFSMFGCSVGGIIGLIIYITRTYL